MYTLKGRTKVITQTRRDAFQSTIDLEKRDPVKVQKRESSSDDSTSSDGPSPLISPRPVFKKHYRMNTTMTHSQVEPTTPEHEENVRYVSSVWNQVEREFTNANRSGKVGPEYYREKAPNPNLKDFEPFDLEGWWGQKTLQKITQST